MAFRGFGDDALAERKAIRTNATQRESIAASERASQRSAAVSMAGIGENARQADMANDRANTQMANAQEVQGANVVLAARNATVSENTSAANIEKGKIDTELGAEDMAMKAKDRETRLGLDMAAETRQQRQLAINEETFLRLESKYQQEAKIQEAWQSEDTAMGIAIMRKMATSTGPVPESFFNSLNQSRGLKKGDKGYISGGFPIIDQKTKEQHGWGMTEYGEDGQEIQTVLEPGKFFEKLRHAMAPEAYMKFLDQVEGLNGFKGIDATKAAIGLERRKLELANASKTIETVGKGEETIAKLSESLAQQAAAGEDTVTEHWYKKDTVKAGDPKAKTEAGRLEGSLATVKDAVASIATNQTGADAGNAPAPADRGAATKNLPSELVEIHKGIAEKVQKLAEKDRPAAYAQMTKAATEEYNRTQSKGESAASNEQPPQEKGETKPATDPKVIEAEKQRRLDNANPVENDEGAGGTGTITKAEYEQAKKEMASGHAKPNSSATIVQYKKENRLDTAGMWETRKEEVAAKRKSKTTPKMSKKDYKTYKDILEYKKENPNGRGMDQFKVALSKTYGFDYNDWDVLEPTQED